MHDCISVFWMERHARDAARTHLIAAFASMGVTLIEEGWPEVHLIRCAGHRLGERAVPVSGCAVA